MTDSIEKPDQGLVEALAVSIGLAHGMVLAAELLILEHPNKKIVNGVKSQIDGTRKLLAEASKTMNKHAEAG